MTSRYSKKSDLIVFNLLCKKILSLSTVFKWVFKCFDSMSYDLANNIFYSVLTLMPYALSIDAITSQIVKPLVKTSCQTTFT